MRRGTKNVRRRRPGAVVLCLVLAAAPLAGCATRSFVPMDAGWEREAEEGGALFRYRVRDVEVLARRNATWSDERMPGDPPPAVAGTIVHRGEGEVDAEFLPPQDGVGRSFVVVSEHVGGPRSTRVIDTGGVPGRRFRLAPSAPGDPGAPATLSFELQRPEAPPLLATGPERHDFACTILLRSPSTTLAIPFRFTTEEDHTAQDKATVALLLGALAGGVALAGAEIFIIAF